MGEVWKAHDPRLHRDVAVKVSAEQFSDRFEREARAVAALNHPHICQIYDVGPNYLVMELVDGAPLRGPLPIEKVTEYARQILDALETAHRKGIIHRDLKPDNILLTRTGVKVLDFGLAKITPGQASSQNETAMATALSLTTDGSILGTVPYMSPEQIEGQDVDARTDIFSFGVVLYELITGSRPFTGKSHTSLIASILRSTPQPVRALQPLTPAGLDDVVQTCLEKDPDKRWQSAREITHALTWSSSKTPSGERATRPHYLWQGLTALSALVALGLAGWVFWPKAPGVVTRLEMTLPADVIPSDSVSISPDGRKVVLTAFGKVGLWLRSLDSPDWRPLPGTEGAWSPFWSPDGRYVAFGVANQLKKVNITGGSPETLCTVPTEAFGSGSWNRDGVIVFGTWSGGAGGPIWKVSASGGDAAAVTQVDTLRGEFFHTWPTFLPDGKHFLYFRSGPPEVRGIYAGSLDSTPAEQPRKRILESRTPAIYANGYLFVPHDSKLWAQPFDANGMQTRDPQVSVAENVRGTWYATGVFSVSPSGALAFLPVLGTTGIQLSWVDRLGRTVSTVGSVEDNLWSSLSPDGKRAVIRDAGFDQPGDLWMVDIASGRRTPLTFRKDVWAGGVWSPDGTRIAYSAGHSGDTLYDRASSGAGDERELLKEPGLRHVPTSWSADSRFLLYDIENTPKTGDDVWVLPLEGNRRPVLLLGEPYNEWAAVFSPDMHWIAYASLEAGAQPEVYVRPFRTSAQTGAPELGEGKWRISKDVGDFPLWHNPNEIVFNTMPVDTAVFAVSVKTGATSFESGVPERLFSVPAFGMDVTADNQRFLVSIGQFRFPPNVGVLLNWPAMLK
jgi:Tol biopolymer transport system component/predicted Ser/Thr protein kinase